MQIGYIKARVYTSDAKIPIKDAVFNVYQEYNGSETLIGTRLTDEEGLTNLIPVEAPDSFLSENQGNFKPFAVVSVRIDHPYYKTVYVNGVQIFAGQISIQEVSMLPMDENVPTDSRAEYFEVPEQNL